VAPVRTDSSREYTSFFTRAKRISELGTTLAAMKFLHSGLRLLVTVNVVPSSPILLTLMMEEIRSSEKSILKRARRCNIPEDGILFAYFITLDTHLPTL
jgi:hypothetical protein